VYGKKYLIMLLQGCIKKEKYPNCHSERSEESSIHAVFGFFTPLRFVQNDTYETVPFAFIMFLTNNRHAINML
jgi:hypothetical protein